MIVLILNLKKTIVKCLNGTRARNHREARICKTKADLIQSVRD